jgi:hypothetical protein
MKITAALNRRMKLQDAMVDIAKAAEQAGLIITPVCSANIDYGFLVTTSRRREKEITTKTIHWLQ